MKFTVSPDERVGKLQGEERNEVSAAIAAELNRVFAIEDTEDAAERAFTMGLLYRGGLAFKVAEGDKGITKRAAEDNICIEALPPYECVWNRKTRSKRTVRHMGHLYVMSKERAEEMYELPENVEGMPLPDVISSGFTMQEKDDHAAEYVRLLELTSFEDVFSEGQAKSQGEFTVWLVDEASSSQLEAYELAREATPYDMPDGTPLSNMVPFISEPAAERPLDSYAPAKSIVDLNAEYNIAASILATAYRRDANRIVLYLKNKGVSDDDISKIVMGEDLQLVGLDAETLQGLFDHLDMPPISGTLLEYIRLLQDSVDRTQLIADFARGKAGDYLSATEVANLVNYTETTIGRIRKRMDATLARVASLYLRALREAMPSKGLDIDVDGKVVTIKPQHLDLRWKPQVVDTASTPAAAAQKLADIMAAQSGLIELAALMQEGGMPGKMAEELLTIIVGLMDLPPSMLPSALASAGEPPPQEEAPPLAPPIPQPPPGAPAELMPGDVANSPVGQAITQQAEEEQLI